MVLSTRPLKAGLFGLAVSACLGAATANALAAEPPATKTAPSKELARTCSVRPDHKLFCENKRGAPLYRDRSVHSPVVDWLDTSPSIFACWAEGEMHAGGNKIWYWTNGDRTKKWGNIPAVHLYTSQDPPPGMNRC